MLADLRITPPTHSGVATYPAGATFGPRAMRDYEFVWIIDGDCEYRWADQTLPAPAGSIVLCRPGETDFFRWDPHRRTQHAYFHFGVQRFPKHWPRLADWPLVRASEPGDVLQSTFRHLLRWISTGDAGLIRLSVAQLLTSFVLGQTATGDIPRDALPEPVERAWRFIRQHLDRSPVEPITLDDLAEAACVTKEHLCRVFAEAIDHSPMETVRLARLDRALGLLARSNYSIGQVATLCGFASSFHFSRRFKDAFGQSPRAMRYALRDGKTPPITKLLTRF
jgi:AraC-like DNA-binding protein